MVGAGYLSGAKYIYQIIDDICDNLKATSGGYWSEIITLDSGATTWNTSVKTGDSARRCLRYLNGAEDYIMAIEQINTSYYYDSTLSGEYGKGFRIVFCSSLAWDFTNHIYHSTNNQSTFIPFLNHSAGIGADISTHQVTYYMYIDATGFVIIGKGEPTGENRQQSFFVVVEHIASDPTPRKMYCHAVTNVSSRYSHGVNTLIRQRGILRPFLYQYPDGGSSLNYGSNGNGIGYVTTPSYYAFKSTGDGKVYYVKPIVCNTANSLTPVFQAELWFPWSETVGLIDGDVIAIEGSTTKYLCKSIDSADSTNRLNFAIKYQA